MGGLELKIDKIFGEGTARKLIDGDLEPEKLLEIRGHTNPKGKPAGHYTGRCMYCHSDDLWDDTTVYGCDFCGKWYDNDRLMIVMNGRASETPEVQTYNKAVLELTKRENK